MAAERATEVGKEEDANLSQKVKNSLYAAYAALQNNKPELAKSMLRTGMLGGNVNDPMDVKHCEAEWELRVASKVRIVKS